MDLKLSCVLFCLLSCVRSCPHGSTDCDVQLSPVSPVDPDHGLQYITIGHNVDLKHDSSLQASSSSSKEFPPVISLLKNDLINNFQQNPIFLSSGQLQHLFAFYYTRNGTDLPSYPMCPFFPHCGITVAHPPIDHDHPPQHSPPATAAAPPPPPPSSSSDSAVSQSWSSSESQEDIRPSPFLKSFVATKPRIVKQNPTHFHALNEDFNDILERRIEYDQALRKGNSVGSEQSQSRGQLQVRSLPVFELDDFDDHLEVQRFYPNPIFSTLKASLPSPNLSPILRDDLEDYLEDRLEQKLRSQFGYGDVEVEQPFRIPAGGQPRYSFDVRVASSPDVNARAVLEDFLRTELGLASSRVEDEPISQLYSAQSNSYSVPGVSAFKVYL